MQTTAEYFIERCKQATWKSVSPSKGGWLLTFDLHGVEFPVNVSVMTENSSDHFLIIWPLGNKIHDDFFPPNERTKLREYFMSIINGKTD